MWLWIALVSLVLMLLWNQYKCNQIIKRLNLPGPKTNPFLGNLPLKWWSAEPILVKYTKIFKEWTKRFGKTFAFQEGAHVVVVSSDLDLLHDVFHKQHANFHERKAAVGLADPNHAAEVFASGGERWKRLRTCVNQCFTTGNIKALSPRINNCVATLCERIDSKVGRPINAYDHYMDFALDTAAKIVFADQNNYQQQTDNIYKHTMSKIFDNNRILNYGAWILPLLQTPLRLMSMARNIFLDNKNIMKLLKQCETVVTKRKEERERRGDGSEKKADFIEYLLDAEDDSGAANVASKKLAENEIVFSMAGLLIAGSDTTAATMTVLSMLLAKYPEVQERLREEIEANCYDEANYDTIQHLRYTEACIKEAMRLVPIASGVVGRTCVKDTFVGTGANKIFIPKGVVVMSDVWTIHYDKEIWGEDADEFRPERWFDNTQRHPMAYTPFGAGRRQCVGHRLAFTELKLALSAVVQRYNIEAHSTTGPPTTMMGHSVPYPAASTLVFTKREEAN